MSATNPTKTEELEARVDLLEQIIVRLPPTSLTQAHLIELLERARRVRPVKLELPRPAVRVPPGDAG